MAAQLEQRLENIVRIGRQMKKRKGLSPSQKKQIDREVGEMATPVVRGIVRALAPDAFPNTQEMNMRVVWGIYWKFQNSPAGAKMSIFDLLAELDRNVHLFLLISPNE